MSNVQHHIFQRKMLGLAPFFFAKQKTLKRKMLNIFLCKKRFGALQNISTCFWCKNKFWHTKEQNIWQGPYREVLALQKCICNILHSKMHAQQTQFSHIFNVKSMAVLQKYICNIWRAKMYLMQKCIWCQNTFWQRVHFTL